MCLAVKMKLNLQSYLIIRIYVTMQCSCAPNYNGYLWGERA